MSNTKAGIGEGILKGLKKILFTDTNANEPLQATPSIEKQAAAPPPENKPFQPVEATGENLKEMKLRIYQLLESINKPGCDFFEVWNASVEMGGASTSNIKAAFTSLRYADKSLTKDKLLDTGGFYISSLQKVLEAETLKRQQEKDKLLLQKEQEKTGLATAISEMEKQMISLQKMLADKRTQQEGIDQKYQPLIGIIDQKISNGSQSVNSIISEMQEVVTIIQKEIN